MTCYEIWSLLIQGAVAVGTLLVAIFAIIIAIWGDRMRSWGFGPKLKLSLLNSKGERNDLNDGRLCRNYHLLVINNRKRAPAHNVQVFLTKIFRSAADGSLVDRSFSGPLQLTWQFPENHPQSLLIGPKRVCDLGRIIKGEPFELMLYFTPISFERYVAATQKIQAEVLAVADNGESEPIRIEIAWDGNWSDDTVEMSDHLRVKEVA
jgi:hypothetical protein